MQRLKKVVKLLFKLLLFVVVVLLLVALIVQIPAVQKSLTGRLESYLENKLQTKVDLESIRLKLPESLVLQNLYVEDLQEDTLLKVGQLSLNFKLNQLLQRKIQFDRIELSDGRSQIHIDCDSTNFDFILAAFAGKQYSNDTSKSSTDESAKWLLTFDAASLNLSNIDFQLSDSTSALFLNTHIGQLQGEIEQIDLLNQNYRFEKLELKDSWVDLDLLEENCPKEQNDERSNSNVLFDILSNAVAIENVRFDLKTDEIDLFTNIDDLKSERFLLKMEEEGVEITAATLNLDNSKLKYQLHTEKEQKDFNYSKLDFEAINVRITNLSFSPSTFDADLLAISCLEKNGFELKNLKSKINYASDEIKLNDFSLTTNHSSLKSKKTILDIASILNVRNSTPNFNIDSDVDLKLKNWSDLAYFYPGFNRIPFLQEIAKGPFDLETNIKGSLTDLNLSSLKVESEVAQIKAKGGVKNIHQSNRLELDVILYQLETSGKNIADLLPDSILPTFVHLPDTISLRGNIVGRLNDFTTTIFAKTNRDKSPFATEVKATANVLNVTKKDKLFLDLQLDTFYTSKTDLLAYLPPNAIPDYMSLPDRFILTGKVKGKLAKMDSDLNLLSTRNNTFSEVKLIGNISGLFTGGNPEFDVNLEAASFSQEELMAFLPDSLLPSQFELPIIKKLTGVFRGGLDDFKTNFKIASNTGEWTVGGFLKNESYELDLSVDDLNANSFFENGYLDSVAGFEPMPLAIDIEMKGKGLDFSRQSMSEFKVTIKDAAEPNMKGLVIEGVLENQILSLKGTAKEDGINLDSELVIDQRTPLPKWYLDMNVDYLDLQELQMIKAPLVLRGEIKGEAEGYTLDTLSGELLISNLLVDYNSKVELVDSVSLVADLDNGQNLIEMSSDVFDAKLQGWFQFPSVYNALQEQIAQYWKYGVADTLIGKTSDHFDLDFALHRPEILTLGFIKGLEDLSPFKLKGNYDNRQAIFEIDTEIPYLNFQNSLIDSLDLKVNASREILNYQLDFDQGYFENRFDVPKFKSIGSLENKRMMNSFRILDEQEKERFNIINYIDFKEAETPVFSFGENQFLNFEKWQLTSGNEMSWVDEKLVVKDWLLSNNDESFEIRDMGDDQLGLILNQFDLSIFDDLLKGPSKEIDTEDYVAKVNQEIGGIVNGNIIIDYSNKEAMLTSDLEVKDVVFFDAQLGTLTAKANNMDNQKISADMTLKGNGNDLQLSGTYDLSSQFDPLKFDLDVRAISLTSIEPLMLGHLEKMTGNLAGQLALNGTFSQPDFTGELKFSDAAFDVELAKARIRLGKQAIIFDSNVIEFKDLELMDEEGNKGIVSSYILTSDYRDFILQTSIGVKDFVVLNTTKEDNDLYYGKLVLDAKAKITGDIYAPVIDIIATTQKESDITYQYTSSSTQFESHEGIVEFVKPESETEKKGRREKLIKVSNHLNMKIIVKMDIDKDLNFKAITDQVTGDFFEGKTKGDLVYIQNPDGTMELNGSLEVIEGKYLFTYQKVVRRPFDLKPGGTISWTKDPFTPQLDLNVNYKVRASTYPLMLAAGDDNSTPSGSLKQTFLVNLNIGGTPLKTEIKSSIEYPSTDGNINNSDVAGAIDRINQNEGQQNSQAFALILFNGFLAQDIQNTEFKVVDISGNISNLITKQLNNLANRYIKFVELDIGLDTYENSQNNSTTDLRVSIRKRFLNDRLTISLDGKTSSEGGQNEEESQTYLDNVSVEYSLTPDGRFKVKIYNKRDYDDFIGGTGVKVGGAFVFSKDFNGLRLFSK